MCITEQKVRNVTWRSLSEITAKKIVPLVLIKSQGWCTVTLLLPGPIVWSVERMWGINLVLVSMSPPGSPGVLLCRANKASWGAEPGTGCRSREPWLQVLSHRYHWAKWAVVNLAVWPWLPSSHGSRAEAQSLMMWAPAMGPQVLTHYSGVSRKWNLSGFPCKFLFIPLTSTDCLTSIAVLIRPSWCSSLTEQNRLPSNSVTAH